MPDAQCLFLAAFPPTLATLYEVHPQGRSTCPDQRHIVGYDEYIKTGGYVGLRKALSMKPDEVTEEVKKSQLRGRGGAGFPTGLKWTFLPKVAPEAEGPSDPGQRYLAVNADESEPGTFKDRLLMDFDPHLLLEGIAIAATPAESKRRTSSSAASTTTRPTSSRRPSPRRTPRHLRQRACSTARGHRQRAAEKWAVDCYVHRGAGAYICGEETALLEAIEGKRGWPRIKPPFPAVKGLFGKPTIINNVETLAHLPSIIENGVGVVQQAGRATQPPVGGPPSYGTKLMGVSGHVNRPGVFEFDLGIPLSHARRTTTAAACATARSSRAPSPAASPWASSARPVRRRAGLRHRPQVQRAGPGHRVPHRLRRGHRHGRRRPQHRAVLQARELRAVHALPRGQRAGSTSS
jgi:hypothetical protein